jgi:hypothetical protein
MAKSNYQIIPLVPAPNQSFSTTVKINGGKTVKMAVFIRYNDIAGYWIMDLSDSVTKAPILGSIPVVPGDYPASNILEPYDYMQIGSAYVVNINNMAQEMPTVSNLGTDWLLVWGDNE